MIDLGVVRPGSTIYIPFASFAGATGAPSAMTGLATTDILIYKNGGTTERASTTGFTLLDTDGLDFDGKTGINGISIDLSSNATAGFYQAGARYFVVIGDVTVDSQTVRFVAATFTIGYVGALLDTTIATLASQTSFTLTVGPAENDALNGCMVVIHDIASAVQFGIGYVSDYVGSTKTVTLAAGVTFTAAAGDNISIFPRWDVGYFAGVVGTFASGIPEVKVNNIAASAITAASIATDAITAAKIADGAIDAGALASDTITAAKIAADALTAAKFAANCITAAKLDPDVTTELQSGLATAANLATVAGYIDTEISDIQSRLPAALVGGRIDATVDGTGMEAGAIDAILDETIGDSTITVRQALKLFVASLGGKVSGGGTTTMTFRNAADDTDVITATVDASGNRSAVTLSL